MQAAYAPLRIRGGHNIDPSVIEEALLRHCDVMLAAAVSKPDAHAGELPIAYVQLVPGSRIGADELRDFALAHVPERAAAPKDVIIVDEMPLTDVRKPAKVALRRDAAQRAFRERLADVTDGAIAVDMVSDPREGSLALVTVEGPPRARQEVEDKIRERMKPFAIAYEVRWTT